MPDDWKAKYQAPEGQIWVCSACGKSNQNRADVGDESCFLNAVLCYDRRPTAHAEERHRDYLKRLNIWIWMTRRASSTAIALKRGALET